MIRKPAHILQKLLTLDPCLRISAKAALQHAYFRDLVSPIRFNPDYLMFVGNYIISYICLSAFFSTIYSILVVETITFYLFILVLQRVSFSKLKVETNK